MAQSEGLRVGVSGVGGGRGQSIMKCLFQSKLAVEVYPADVTPFAAGLYRGRHAGVVLPKPEEDIAPWLEWAEANKLDAILPGSDHDLLPFAEARDEFEDIDCFVMVSCTEAVKISNDKKLTMDALANVGLDFPHYTGFSAQLNYGETVFTYPDKWPVVIKPRFGMTSRGLHIAHDPEELLFYWKRAENPIVQEYLEGEEYTCALFYNRKSAVTGCFVARRELWGGTTWKAEIRDFPEIREYLVNEWGPKMAVYGWGGPINVQLKDVPGRGPVAFEVNAACSGSTTIRASFGYNEPERVLRHFVLGEPSRMNEDCPVGYVLRYADEVILFNITREQIEQQQGKLKGVIPSWL
jgi:carbamoyl-phosphate synthase large subunit